MSSYNEPSGIAEDRVAPVPAERDSLWLGSSLILPDQFPADLESTQNAPKAYLSDAHNAILDYANPHTVEPTSSVTANTLDPESQISSETIKISKNGERSKHTSPIPIFNTGSRSNIQGQIAEVEKSSRAIGEHIAINSRRIEQAAASLLDNVGKYKASVRMEEIRRGANEVSLVMRNIPLHDRLQFADLVQPLHDLIACTERIRSSAARFLDSMKDSFKSPGGVLERGSLSGLFYGQSQGRPNSRSVLLEGNVSVTWASERLKREVETAKSNFEAILLAVQAIAEMERINWLQRNELQARDMQLSYLQPLKSASPATAEGSWCTSLSSQRKSSELPTIDGKIRHIAKRFYRPTDTFKDVVGSYVLRHRHFRSRRIRKSAMWLIYDKNFGDWLSYKSIPIMWCHGPEGAGKSVLVSRVIDSLDRNDRKYAYFYLGNGKVQSASGLILALLEQLCAYTDYFPPCLGAVAPDSSDTVSHATVAADQPSLLHAHSSGLETIVEPPEHRFESTPFVPQDFRARSLSQSSFTEALRSGVLSSPTISNDENPTTVGQQPSTNHASVFSEERSSIDRYGDHGELYFYDATEEDNSSQSNYRPDFKTLLEALHDVCTRRPDEYFIILDAWDVSNMDSPNEFRGVLNAIQAVPCKTLVTSQTEPDKDLADILTISIDAHQNTFDIRNFIERHIREQNQSWPQHLIPEDIPAIARGLAAKSGGIFSLAEINTRILLTRRNSLALGRNSRQEALSELSSQREDIIRQGIKQLKERPGPAGGLSEAVLIWLIKSKWPLSQLAFQESFPIAWKSFARKELARTWKDHVATSGETSDKNYLKASEPSYSDVLKWCEPFVVIDHGNLSIHVAFQEVVGGGTQLFCPHCSAEIQSILTMTCLEYLLREDFTISICQTERQLIELLSQHPFLEYAAHSWADHARGSLDISPATCDSFSDVNKKMDELSGEDEGKSTLNSVHAADSVAPTLDPDPGIRIDNLSRRLFATPKNLFLTVQVLLYTGQEPPSLDAPWGDFVHTIMSMSKLHMASYFGAGAIAKSLLQDVTSDPWDTDPRVPDIRGSTALHDAAKNGFEDVVTILLDAKAPTAVLDNTRHTPIYYARKNGHLETFARLFEGYCAEISSGHDVDVIDDEKSLVMEYCRYRSGLADQERSKEIAMLQAIKHGKDGVATLLLNRGVDKSCKDDDDLPALYLATKYERNRVLRELLFMGADPSFKISKDPQESSLHLAARLGSQTAVSLLLDNGADINSLDNNDRSVLFAALEIENGKDAYSIVRFLLQRGVNVDQEDRSGRRILHVAAEKGFTNLLPLFLFRAQDRSPKDNSGKTPLDYAMEGSHTAAEGFLRHSIESPSMAIRSEIQQPSLGLQDSSSISTTGPQRIVFPALSSPDPDIHGEFNFANTVTRFEEQQILAGASGTPASPHLRYTATGSIGMRKREVLPEPEDVFQARENMEEPEIEMKKNYLLVKHRKIPKDDLLASYYSERDITFLVDNAESMSNHWYQVKFLLETLLMKVEGIAENGVDIAFTQGEMRAKNVRGKSNFMSRMKDPRVTPQPGKQTDMVSSLKGLFDEYLRYASRQTLIVRKLRKLAIIVLTDGLWVKTSHKDEVKKTIVLFIESLEKRMDRQLSDRPVSIEFVQFGSHDAVSLGLQHLEDDLESDGAQSIVDTEDSLGDVNKMLLGSLVESWDRPNS